MTEIVPALPATIRYSEPFNVPPAELMKAARKHQLEGIVAKRSAFLEWTAEQRIA
jgi:hypothetical protein